MTDRQSSVKQQALLAKSCAPLLGSSSAPARNQLLRELAERLIACQKEILAANQIDLDQASGLSTALRDRLQLTPERIRQMAEGVKQVAELPTPNGEIIEDRILPNALKIQKVRVPLGVVAIIYEARPNVTIDALALTFKTANCVLLRGSANCLNSNRCLLQIVSELLVKHNFPIGAAQLIEDRDRQQVEELLTLRSEIDVIIPRGGAGLIQHVVQNSTIPVIETGAGNCHLFIDKSADFELAEKIAINAKTQRPSVCNAIETLLIHQEWAASKTQALLESLHSKGVELRCCPKIRAILPEGSEANPEDWEREYGELILAVKSVADVGAAIEHINQYGTRHSEAIISSDSESVALFFSHVDAAAIYHNSSTRFTDGFEFGLGAEIGISTQKLHARGPMGLKELTTYKYCVTGNGQIRA